MIFYRSKTESNLSIKQNTYRSLMIFHQKIRPLKHKIDDLIHWLTTFILIKKRRIIMLGLGPRSLFRGGFKKLDILTVPSLCICLLMMFAIRNPDSFQTNSSVHSINMRKQNQLHLPSVKFSSVQEGVTYSSIKIFNNYRKTYQTFIDIQFVLSLH